MGRRHRTSSARAAGRGPHGPEEDVGDTPEGRARIGLSAGAGRTGTGARRELVSSRASHRRVMRILMVASDRMEFPGILAHAKGARPAPIAVDWARETEISGNPVLLAANGAGARRAAAAVDAALDAFPADAIVSTGFCGALSSDLAV